MLPFSSPLERSATGAERGAATVVVEPPSDWIQPAAMASQPRAATIAPPSSAEANGVRRTRRALVMGTRMDAGVEPSLNALERFSKSGRSAGSVEVLAGAVVGAGQFARLRLGIGGGHQGSADQHRVDTDPLQLLQLRTARD